MKRPVQGKSKRRANDNVPTGGSAMERVRQDRAARGLKSSPAPGTLIVTDDTPAVPTAPKKQVKRKAP